MIPFRLITLNSPFFVSLRKILKPALSNSDSVTHLITTLVSVRFARKWDNVTGKAPPLLIPGAPMSSGCP